VCLYVFVFVCGVHVSSGAAGVCVCVFVRFCVCVRASMCLFGALSLYLCVCVSMFLWVCGCVWVVVATDLAAAAAFCLSPIEGPKAC